MVIVIGIIAAVASLYLVIALGYLVGMLLAITPFVNEWLTVGGVIDTAQMPGIVAWVFLVALIAGANVRMKSGDV